MEVFGRQRGEIGIAQSPRQAARAAPAARNRISAQASSPTRAEARAALLEQNLLQRVLRVAGSGERHHAAVAVALGAEPLEAQGVPGGDVLQGGAAVLAGLDAGQPQLAAVSKQQRAAIADGGDLGRAEAVEATVLLRRRVAYEQRTRVS